MGDIEYAECSVCGTGSKVRRLYFECEDKSVDAFYLALCPQCKPRDTRKPDWVSVEDELPHKGYAKPYNEEIIIDTGEKVTTTTIHSAWWNTDGNPTVVRWMRMPLPAPSEGS